ncbi:hypothetical protein [Methylobacterium sp. R2-1]|uniref:hypothetical protein n=1 Tax=Methylobacterium sp. R2-1 TaxID=2587064 RepID=UPI0016143D19|nr:hypothetical protein [Methylobacterium sp. R2-1]MBB2964077.1 hypothetical protein [Methylobacterium sp. R2-1]
MKFFVAAAMVALPAAAFAAGLPGSGQGQTSPDPMQQALAHMIGEAQQREAAALVQVYALRAQLEAEKKRADQAEENAETGKPAQ